MINTHKIETVLTENGTLILQDLPFQAGESVEVIILALSPQIKSSIKHPLDNLTKEEPITKIRESLSQWENNSEITDIFSQINQKRHAYHGRPLVSFDE